MRIHCLLGFVLCLALASGVTLTAAAASQPRQDRAWKVYQDKESGYCISYPSRWIKARGFESAGVSVTTGVTRFGLPIASLDVTTIPDEPASLETRQVSLSDDYATHLAGLKQFIRAEHVETLEERPLAVSGLNGLLARVRYSDPKEKSDWIEEVVFVRQHGTTFLLELQSKANAWDRFQPIFEHFVDSFQVACGQH